MPQPAEPEPSADDGVAGVWISVERTGGFAGLTRRWSVRPAPHDEGRWRALVDECPWEAVESAPPAPDRFCWSVTAGVSDGVRSAELAETDVAGPWRALIDAVRAAGTPGSTPEE
jgi:hypothetical protein